MQVVVVGVVNAAIVQHLSGSQAPHPAVLDVHHVRSSAGRRAQSHCSDEHLGHHAGPNVDPSLIPVRDVRPSDFLPLVAPVRWANPA